VTSLSRFKLQYSALLPADHVALVLREARTDRLPVTTIVRLLQSGPTPIRPVDRLPPEVLDWRHTLVKPANPIVERPAEQFHQLFKLRGCQVRYFDPPLQEVPFGHGKVQVTFIAQQSRKRP
jgi:hypothetical protein